MTEHREIRIVIEAGSRDMRKAQEAVIRAMFQRYFAKDGYRVAVTLVFSQMLGVFAGMWMGVHMWAYPIIILGAGLGQAAVRGLALWASTPPPQPPSQGDSAPPA